MVPYEGPENADIYLIGEAPGAAELKQKRPFVGPSGKLLNGYLASAGIPRSSIRIGNVITEDPKDLKAWILIGETKAAKNRARKSHIDYIEGGDVLYTEAFKESVERLYADIRKTKPRVIVPMGNIALYAMTQYTQITKRRGSVYFWEGIPVVPTLHPSSCFRVYLNQYLIMTDLKKAAMIAEHGYQPTERNLIISPSFYETIEYLKLCKEQDMVAFDIETVRTKSRGKFQDWEISCLSFSTDALSAICIPFLDESRNNYFSESQEVEIWMHIQDILLDRGITKIGQNILFDLTFIEKKLKIRLGPVHDTMFLQALANPDFEKSLGFLCSIYSTEPYYKDEGKQHKSYGGASVENFWLYSAKDSAVLWEILPPLLDEVEQLGNMHIYKGLQDLVPVLADIQQRGIRVDAEALKEASKAMESQLKDLRFQLNEVSGQELNPNSPDQLKAYFYIKKKERAYLKNGRPTVDIDALKRLAIKGYKEADLILKIRKISKLKSTYIDVTLDEDERLRSSYNPVGTVTGRLASRSTIFGTGGNSQNQPSEFKKFLFADEGYIAYELDLSQAENRIVAYISPERKMIEAFETGKDVHSLTASLISGIDYDEIRAQNAAGVPANLGRKDKPWRYWGKVANHSLNYKIGPKHVALSYEIPLEEAKYLIESYYSAYPGIRQFHGWVEAEIKSKRRLVNCMGRTRMFLDRLEQLTKAYAYIPQSTVATKINHHGMLPLFYEERFRDVEILNQIHDSIVIQIKKEKGLNVHWEILSALKESLETPISWKTLTFSIPAEIKGGTCLGELKEVKSKEDLATLFEACR